MFSTLFYFKLFYSWLSQKENIVSINLNVSLSSKPKICTKTQFHKQVGGELGGDK